MRVANFILVMPIAAMCLLTLGCGKKEPPLHPVSGKILYLGKPIPKAQIVFHPQFQGPGWMPIAKVERDGIFKMTTKTSGDGVLEGKYKITVTWPESSDYDAPNRLPERYADPSTSNLECEIKPGANTLPTIELTE